MTDDRFFLLLLAKAGKARAMAHELAHELEHICVMASEKDYANASRDCRDGAIYSRVAMKALDRLIEAVDLNYVQTKVIDNP